MSVWRGLPGWLLLLAAGVAGWGQAAQTNAAGDTGSVETKSGVLRVLTTTEADVDASDAQGKPKEFVFVRDAATKCDAVKAGDHVNVIYVTHGEKYTAVRIVLAGVTTPGQPVPLQGVYGVASAQPPEAAANATTMASTASTEAGTASSNASNPSAVAVGSVSSPAASSHRTNVTTAGLGTLLGRQETAASKTSASSGSHLVGLFGNKTSSTITETKIKANEIAWEMLLDKAKASGSGTAEVSAVLELEPGNTLATRADAASPARNTCTYKDGRFTCSSVRPVSLGIAGWTGAEGPGTRTAQPGEGLTLRRIEYRPEGVVLDLASGATTDRPFYATVKVPFEEGKAPSNEVLASSLPQLLKVYSLGPEAGEAAAATGSSAASAGASSATAAAAEGVPSGVPSIRVGMTTAEVTGVLGQPEKIVNLGTKVIYFYPQMKATFVEGKLTDVQ